MMVFENTHEVTRSLKKEVKREFVTLRLFVL